MSTEEIIALARKHLGGPMESSARLCLFDAIELMNDGRFSEAKERAMRSLQYSVGIFHPDCRRVSKAVFSSTEAVAQ